MKLAEGSGAPDDPVTRAALVEQVRISLQVRPSFPILGLSHPALTPSRLVDLEQVGGRIDRLSLGYGEADGSAGRFVLIVSGDPGRELDDLAGLLESEADRLGGEVTQDPPTAPDLTPAGGLRLNIPMEVDGLIVVDGLPVPAHLRRQGRLWAAHITVSPGRVVTVVARGVDPGTLQLSEIADLRPYVAAWEEHQLKAVAAAAFMTPQRTPGDTPAQGLDAHVALLRACLGPRLAAGRAGTGAIGLLRRGSGTGEHATRWDAAVGTQMHYAKQPAQDADEAVGAMVNQAARLAERATWLTDARKVDRALEEMARYTVFDSDVPSRRAQEWWGRVWSLTIGATPTDPELARERHREHAATEAVWLTAWERWANGDEGRPGRR